MGKHAAHGIALCGMLLGFAACNGGEEAATPDAGGDVAAEVAPEAIGDVPVEGTISGADPLAPGPYAVGVRTETLVDDARVTPAHGEHAELPERTLVGEIWYPALIPADAPEGAGTVAKPARDAAFDPVSAPQPLIVYLHGFMSARTENAPTAANLASRGFVVVAVDGPLTRLATPGGAVPDDVVNEPGDARFLIDHWLAKSAAAGEEGLGIDEARIGVTGISLGSMAALLAGMYGDYHDPRVQAVATVAAPGCYLPDDFYADCHVPVLFVHGTMDAVVPYDAHAPRSYQQAPAPKWLVTIEGGTHAGIAGTPASLAAHFENPDLVSCHAMTTNPSVSADVLNHLASEAGGDPVAVIEQRCPAPCDYEGDLPPALNALEQVRVVERSLVSFWEGTLGGHVEYLDYLDQGLALDEPSATVESAR